MSVLVDHVISTGHNLKWDLFEILTTGRFDRHCTIKEIPFVRDLQPSLMNTLAAKSCIRYMQLQCIYFLFRFSLFLVYSCKVLYYLLLLLSILPHELLKLLLYI